MHGLWLLAVAGHAAADDRPSRPLGKLPRPLALGSSQLSLPAEDPTAFAASLNAGTWLTVGTEEIPLRRASSSPGAVVLELLWPTGSAHYEGTPLALLLSPAGCDDDPPSTMVLSQLPPAGGAWPRWLGALDLSAPSLSHPLLLVYQPRSGAFGVSALPADASRCNGPSAPLASGRLAPFRRHVALPGGQLLSFSPRDGSFEAFRCDWQQLLPPASQRAGRVDALSYNRSRAVDRLPCVRQTHGNWPALRGFELSVVGVAGRNGMGARLLAFDEATARYSLWEYDADVTGSADPIRFSEGAVASGSWQRTLGEAPQQLSLLQPVGGDASLRPAGQEARRLPPPPTVLLRDASSASYALWAAEWLASSAAGAHVMDGNAMDGGDAGCAGGECRSMENALQPQAMEMLRSLGALPPQANTKVDTTAGGKAGGRAEAPEGEAPSRPRLTPELLRDDDGAIYTPRLSSEQLRPVAATARWSSAPSHRLEPLPAAAHRNLAALWVEAGVEGGGKGRPEGAGGEGVGEGTGEVAGEVTLVEWDAAGSSLFRLLGCRYSARGMRCDTLHGGHALRPAWPCDARTSAAGCAQQKDLCLWCGATHRCVPAAIGSGGRSPCLDGYIEGVC